jgi:hypothetical protein
MEAFVAIFVVVSVVATVVFLTADIDRQNLPKIFRKTK